MNQNSIQKIIPFTIPIALMQQVQEETDNIVLNAVDLVIKHASIRLDGSDDALKTSDITFCLEQETVTLKFPKALPSSATGILDVSFSGCLNDKMKGFYRSKYYTQSGEERYGGVTQL